MLIVFKSHAGGVELPLAGIKLSGYGLIDNIDESAWELAKSKYPFLTEWERDGLIEANQNRRKDEESFENAKKAQNEKTAKSNVKAVKA